MHEFYGNKIEFVRRALVRRLWALLYGSASPLVTDATTQLTTPALSSSPLDQVNITHHKRGTRKHCSSRTTPIQYPKNQSERIPKCTTVTLPLLVQNTHRDKETWRHVCVCFCVKAMHEPQTGTLYSAHSH